MIKAFLVCIISITGAYFTMVATSVAITLSFDYVHVSSWDSLFIGVWPALSAFLAYVVMEPECEGEHG